MNWKGIVMGFSDANWGKRVFFSVFKISEAQKFRAFRLL